MLNVLIKLLVSKLNGLLLLGKCIETFYARPQVYLVAILVGLVTQASVSEPI